MSRSCFLPRFVAALSVGFLSVGFLSVGCKSLDWPVPGVAPDPVVSVTPVESDPAPGMIRSGESFTGKVSWYSVRTNGGTRTASGETFADHHDTAAHRTLPFGTLIEVTNLANEQSVVLRVNDRGPFKHGRVLDVSLGAAKKLGFDKKGLTSCRIEVLKPREGSQTEGGE